MTWQIHPRMAWQVLDGKAVLIDLDAGVVAGFNATGTLVWQLIEAGRRRDDLVTEIAHSCGIPLPEAEQDVGTFLDLLESKGWIEAQAD